MSKPKTVIRMSAAHHDMTSSIGGQSAHVDFAAIPANERKDALASYAKYVCELHGIKAR